MTLDEMKKIAAARTIVTPGETKELTEDDWKFISICFTNWDKLIKVVDAAKNLVPRNNPKLGQEIVQGWDILYFAIKELEQE